MSVKKSKRKESQFEVFHHLYKMRKEVTDLLLRDFGYSESKAEKYRDKMFGDKQYDELTDSEKTAFDRRKKRDEAFEEWFIIDQRKAVVDKLREITGLVYQANSIYPVYGCELMERRLLQDKAVGLCYGLMQELQYAIETLPVDINKYTRFAEMMQTEINLIKGWRKSDNKFKTRVVWSECPYCPFRATSDSSANFANVNNNGNANYNNASNSYGVRPDFNCDSKAD